MMGCVDLGINTAFRAHSLGEDPLYRHGLIKKPNVLDDNNVSFARQALPEWGSRRRANKVWEPYPVWVGHSGMWGDGPAYYHGYATWQIEDEFYRSTSAGCEHLTCAANCRLDIANGNIIVGETHEFAIRPYWWTEPEVQDAYEQVSDGEIPADRIDALAEVGKEESFPDRDPEYGPIPTADDEEFIREAHSYDSAVASYLCFGARDKRPFCWHRKWADRKMAVPYGSENYYDKPPVETQHTTFHFSRESGRRGTAGQAFLAWRRCGDGGLNVGDNGVLSADDWGRIGFAIAHSWNAPKELVRKEVETDGGQTETVRVRRLAFGTMGRPNRQFEAFDVRIYKTVMLTRGKWRLDEHGNPIQHGSQGRPPNVAGKECGKRYDIEAWWISGSPPKNYGPTRTFPFIEPDQEHDPERDKLWQRWLEFWK